MTEERKEKYVDKSLLEGNAYLADANTTLNRKGT